MTETGMTDEGMVAILAAGEARRFGGAKLDAVLAGKPVGRWVVDVAFEAASTVIVITRPGPPPSFLEGAGQRIVRIDNADHALGPSSSLRRAAMFAQQTGAPSLLIMLADMPLVSSTSLLAIRDAADESGMSAVRYPDGSPGVPACFDARWFDAMSALEPGAGAKSLLRSFAGCRLVDAPRHELIDIDTPGDLIGAYQALIAHGKG